MKTWKPGHAVFEYDMPQLRMQALEIITRTRAYSSDQSLFQAIDLYVHYCLTGEHQLPEKKE